ncbi:unnamed protein product [Ascophyllum nodosum]
MKTIKPSESLVRHLDTLGELNCCVVLYGTQVQVCPSRPELSPLIRRIIHHPSSIIQAQKSAYSRAPLLPRAFRDR